VFPATRVSNSHVKVNWLASVTGRVGYASSNWLFYAKGGGAWAHKETNSATVNPAAGGALVATTTGDNTRSGWTVGGGVEWGFWQNWSAMLEYDFMDFGTTTELKSATYVGPVGLNPLLKSTDFRMNVVKLGVNYRFGWLH
jgi:outer membrane immunogenic protein